MQIVIAWTDNYGLRDTGKTERFDGVNWRPKMEVCEEPRACMWLSDGKRVDVVKAREYIEAKDDCLRKAVYTFPAEEQDPLGQAKKRIMQKRRGK